MGRVIPQIVSALCPYGWFCSVQSCSIFIIYRKHAPLEWRCFLSGGNLNNLYSRLAQLCGEMLTMCNMVDSVNKPILQCDDILIRIEHNGIPKILHVPYSIASMTIEQFNTFIVKYIKEEGLI